MVTSSDSPSGNDLEVNLFGPGLGESSVIHIGNGKWVIVDSCIDFSSSRPAALNYLEEIGVDCSTSVVLIVVTHFHDDHIRGICEIAKKCTSAVLCMSAAFHEIEFRTLLALYNKVKGPVGTGVSELYELLKMQKEDGRDLKHALVDKVVYEKSESGWMPSIKALSPSDEQLRRSLASVGSLMPTKNEAHRRMPNDGLNHYSVVLCVQVNGASILMGGDLEQTTSLECGWNAVVAAHASGVSITSSVFKIPHHGSENGHNDDVWANMLVPDCWAILTPFNKGRKKRPSAADVERILNKTTRAYVTAPQSAARTRKSRPSAVERSIREVAGRLRTVTWSTGHIRLRRKSDEPGSDWNIELFNGARSLASLS